MACVAAAKPTLACETPPTATPPDTGEVIGTDGLRRTVRMMKAPDEVLAVFGNMLLAKGFHPPRCGRAV